MNGVLRKPDNQRQKLPRWWIRLMAVCCAIVLCSCQTGLRPVAETPPSLHSFLKATQLGEKPHATSSFPPAQPGTETPDQPGSVPAIVDSQNSGVHNRGIILVSNPQDQVHSNMPTTWLKAEGGTFARTPEIAQPPSSQSTPNDPGVLPTASSGTNSTNLGLAPGAGTLTFLGHQKPADSHQANYQASGSTGVAEGFSATHGEAPNSFISATASHAENVLRLERAPFIPREGPVYLYQPPGARQPWPADEYLAAGGDHPPGSTVDQEWMIRGLQPGETIAHYDTVAGQRVVEPTNPVYLYSPRFGAVRQVVGFRSEEQWEQLAAAVNTFGLARQEDRNLALSSKQHYQPLGQAGERRLVQVQSRSGEGALSAAVGPRGFHDGLLPYENLEVVRTGKFDSAEFALVAAGAAAAQAWFHTAVVQVFIDRKAAVATEGITSVDVIYGVDEPPSHPRLRVIKLASRHHAAPGELVHFTIRFDNVGNELIGNVTIVDSLPTRLEYIPGSAQCSVPAQFSTEENEAGSLILRWEITHPLEPGQGGVIRFQCRVR